jgi:nucleoside-diphosphate-sugar epimerase
LAKKKLSWEPKTTLNDGIQQTISYFSDLIA